jgi:L,D-peptidoglycan transpeptidase YkuD (ErfK/YbiS/YcfS/YnhG family)
MVSRRKRRIRVGAAGVLTMSCLACLAGVATTALARSSGARFDVPAAARELVLVSSPTYRPAGYLASLSTYQRSSASAPWRPVFGSWQAEIGSGGLRDVRREGDHATPTGVYPFGPTIYGNRPNPGGLHEGFHHLVCGDWWDEDPYRGPYNRFLHVPCGSTPAFASWSEALWTETRAYPYFAVIDYNDNPTVAGPNAPGSGIFLHAWMGEATEGCVALHIPQLLRVLRWLDPAEHPAIEIGTRSELGRLPPPPA